MRDFELTMSHVEIRKHIWDCYVMNLFNVPFYWSLCWWCSTGETLTIESDKCLNENVFDLPKIASVLNNAEGLNYLYHAYIRGKSLHHSIFNSEQIMYLHITL
jgi:hypothetical protein